MSWIKLKCAVDDKDYVQFAQSEDGSGQIIVEVSDSDGSCEAIVDYYDVDKLIDFLKSHMRGATDE